MIGIIDYGVGNLFSVSKLIKRLNIEFNLISDPKLIEREKIIILPGVGSFPEAMSNIRAKGMDVAIQNFADSGQRIVGICLGMQLLFDESFEHQRTGGLGLIPGKVCPIETSDKQKVPNIGWCEIECELHEQFVELKNIAHGKDFYFAHSYRCKPERESHCIASIANISQKIPAVISNNHNIFGIQFHPELSDIQGEILFDYLLKN